MCGFRNGASLHSPEPLLELELDVRSVRGAMLPVSPDFFVSHSPGIDPIQLLWRMHVVRRRVQRLWNSSKKSELCVAMCIHTIDYVSDLS